MVRNERIIINIDPFCGVTATQLWEHCSAIVDTIPASRSLDYFDKQTAVNNAVMALLKKMQEGKLDKYDYFVFRGYLFRSLTNSVLRQIAVNKAAKLVKGTEDFQDY